MNTNNQPIVVKQGPSTLARAKFGPGMLLQHDDLEQLNVYTRELNRLMFRSLFGCGVVCGLVVDTEVKCGRVTVTVGSGLALDCEGDPIHVPKPQTLVLDEECNPGMPERLWVVLCGIEKCCSPRTSMCASDEDESPSVCTRERDYWEIRVVSSRPRCVCGCAVPDQNPDYTRRDGSDNKCKCVDPESPCYKDHYDGKCGCDCDGCAECDCNCVLLARLKRNDDREHPEWTVDHRVRRFVRPVLMRDRQVEREEQDRKDKDTKGKEQRSETKQQPESKAAPKEAPPKETPRKR